MRQCDNVLVMSIMHDGWREQTGGKRERGREREREKERVGVCISHQHQSQVDSDVLLCVYDGNK